MRAGRKGVVIATFTIKHRLIGKVLYEAEAETLKAAVLAAKDAKADLRGADLRGAYLRGADLSRADLRGAELRDIKVSWQSHALLGELLRRTADGDVEKLKIAGLISITIEWCWSEFLAIEDPLREWAIETLIAYVKDGDDAPEVLRRIAAAKAQPTATASEEA